MSSAVPQQIGRYRVTRTLGEGGMGVVYAAVDERLARPVALKMIRAGAEEPRARERFWREARAAASVNHPNICQLYEIGEEEGAPFIAMELLEGESLADRLTRGPLPLSEAVQTMLAVLSALDALHRRNVLHRDLKPSNVFLTPHGIKLLDFGLARSLGDLQTETVIALTLPGTIVGTPQYLSPEQLRGEPTDARADIFAAGVVLFEALAGRPPFGGATVAQVLSAILRDQPPVLGGSAAAAAVDRVIHRALAKRPADRYPTAEAMAADLRAALLLGQSGETARARPMTRLIVLPFRILRSDPETDFLAFSLPDAVTTALSGLESLVVRSSVTAASLAGATIDLHHIAEKADVDVVLTGTLLRAGDQIRVNTQLVQAPDGSVLWTQTSQAPIGDVFQLQDDLTRRIVESLSLPLTARDRRLLTHDVPASPQAYEFYLRGNQVAYESKHWTVARDLYLRCVEEDPHYAPAWARLGRIYLVIGKYGSEGFEANYGRSQAAFGRALEINPDLPLAHNLYTNLEVEIGRAPAAMLRLIQQARTRAPHPDLLAGLVQACRYCGLLEASVAAYEQAHRLDPTVRTSVAHSLLMLGDYERSAALDVEDPPLVRLMALALSGRGSEAIETLRHLEAQSPPRNTGRWLASMRLALEGKREAALEITEQLAASWKSPDPCARFYLARTFAYLHDPRARDMLREAVEGGYYCYAFLTRDPWLDGLRTDPQFRTLVRTAETNYRGALDAFLAAGGDHLLGLTASLRGT
jgi:serine/threonine protein kinase/tetratricopeptide (TPR) repeat protein